MMVCAFITVLGLFLMLAAAPLGHHASGLFKIVASTGFIALGIAAGGFHTPFGRLVLVGLFFSWWGDFFLISGNDKIFLMGVAAFFLAHVAYCAAFLVNGVEVRWILWSAPWMLALFGLVGWWLHPHLGDMRIPVYAYMVVITLMVVLAAGATGAPGVAGAGRHYGLLAAAVLFYLSDLFVARDRFVSHSIINPLFGLPLYYAAQIWFGYNIAILR